MATAIKRLLAATCAFVVRMYINSVYNILINKRLCMYINICTYIYLYVYYIKYYICARACVCVCECLCVCVCVCYKYLSVNTTTAMDAVAE